MKYRIKPVHLAWAIPFAHMIHFAEEYFGGLGFPEWINSRFNADMLNDTFVTVNLTGSGIMFLFAILFSIGISLNLVLLALGTMYFVNGFLHLGMSIYTSSYSPGLVTGIIIFIPIGLIIFLRILPQMNGWVKVTGILLGILVHIVASSAALNI